MLRLRLNTVPWKMTINKVDYNVGEHLFRNYLAVGIFYTAKTLGLSMKKCSDKTTAIITKTPGYKIKY